MLIDQRLGGDIVYISSKNSVFAGPNNIAYSATKADQAHQVRLLAAELGEHGIKVNGINPDGVVRGSGIFAGGWGANRAAVYGVEEEDLGKFYAQRTLLKREVLPENIANAVFVLCTSGPLPHHRPAHPGRRRRRGGVPAMTGRTGQLAAVDLGATSGRVMLGHGRPGRRWTSEPVHRFANGRSYLWNGQRAAALGRARAVHHVCSGLARGAPTGAGPDRHRHRLLGRRLRAAPRRGRSRAFPITTATPACERASTSCTQSIPQQELYAVNGFSSCRSTRSTSSPPMSATAALEAADTAAARSRPARLLAHRRGPSPSAPTPPPPACSTSTAGWDDRADGAARPARRAVRRRSSTPATDRGPDPAGAWRSSVGLPASRRHRGRLARHRLGGGRRARWPRKSAAYISCGTWGWSGVELDAPVLTEAARSANFTNEGGVDGRSASCAT